MKIYSLLLVLVMALALTVFTACGGKDKTDDDISGETKADQVQVTVSGDVEKVTAEETEEETFIPDTFVDPAATVTPEDVVMPEPETGAPEDTGVYIEPGGEVIPVETVERLPEENVEVNDTPETQKETTPPSTKPVATTGFRPNPNGIELPEDHF